MPPGTSKPPSRAIRRCLFGRPTDNSMEELAKKLNHEVNEKSRHWRFDFTRDRPLNLEDVDFQPLTITDVPSFYLPRIQKGNTVSLDILSTSNDPRIQNDNTVPLDIPSTSNDSPIRVTRSAKRRLENGGSENGAPMQKQASIMNFVTVTKRRSGKLPSAGDTPAATPSKLARSHSDDPESSPFRYVSADAERHTTFTSSPSVSPRKSPRKQKPSDSSPKPKKLFPKKHVISRLH